MNDKNKYILIGWTVKNKQQLDKYKNCCDNLIVDGIL